ncbi:SpoIID/LytB domain-containing protein [Nodosilinea sp. E11]|uniref:SpoIID/LytB domain-containing protein n=1 Tax=Nodosilinea sp. E11 TaxID=3037479 RepID=UPI00293456BD|nr:SpoIID/LytB domain-containing protein [Nodosilinea sp. E11]WOD37449.1 SpoIID/LytB domain-containing protein [Nodosilinea sp. E11]
MGNLWKARLPKLGSVQLKSVRLKPLHLRWPQTGSLGRSPWVTGEKGARLKVFGGLAFASLLLVQVSSPLGSHNTAKPRTLSPALWQTTGMVRQSIVDLYRARRLLVQATIPAEPETASPNAAAAAPPPSGQPVVASAAATAQPQATTTGAARSLPQPAAPPAPAAANSAFDPSKTIDTNLEMRVALAKNASTLEVATSVNGYLMDLSGQNYCNLPAQSSVVLRPQGSGIAAGSCSLSNSVWLEPGEGGYVYVGNSWYKGRVLLLTDGSGLMAVNFVLMHDYLSSVVGSEMYVSWPLEALKAQAVAARSYALVHHVRHAKRAYDLDNTQRYQAYLGIAKETNTTQAAVVATTGEFISHNGGIVESLYAASDAIVQAAHGGNGMSQTGAMELATKGYNYTQILSNYYPGTSLSRLVVE